jgi:hypothetical protein
MEKKIKLYRERLSDIYARRGWFPVSNVMSTHLISLRIESSGETLQSDVRDIEVRHLKKVYKEILQELDTYSMKQEEIEKLANDKSAYAKDKIFKSNGGRSYVEAQVFNPLGAWLFETYLQSLAQYRITNKIFEFVCYMPSFYTKVMSDYLQGPAAVVYPDHGDGSYHPRCMGIEILPGYENFMVFAPDQESMGFGNLPIRDSLILKIPLKVTGQFPA